MRGPRPSDPASPAGPEPLTTPVPTGSRDVLPEEMSELRQMSAQMLAEFARAGYGEVATPAFEYEETMRLAGPLAARDAYRVADNDGRMLVARFDSTIPIARLAATRYRDAETPLRFCYLQSVYRPVEPKRGQSREFLQIGMELIGLAAPEGDAETIRLLVGVMEAAGLADFTIAVGDARYFIEQLDADSEALTAAQRAAILYELQTRDLVGLQRELHAVESISTERRDRLLEVAGARGGGELLARHGAPRLAALDDKLRADGVAERVVYDLGLVRSLDYYTGMVLEVFVPGEGFPIGGGGRYDDLAGRFGRPLPAAGFAINMERLHLAVMAQSEGTR